MFVILKKNGENNKYRKKVNRKKWAPVPTISINRSILIELRDIIASSTQSIKACSPYLKIRVIIDDGMGTIKKMRIRMAVVVFYLFYAKKADKRRYGGDCDHYRSHKAKNISAKCRVKWRNSIINAEWKARIIFFLREKEISSTHWAVEADLLLILVFFTKSHYDTVFFCLKA